MIEIEPTTFYKMLTGSSKKVVDLCRYSALIENNFYKYGCENKDWFWVLCGAPREGGDHDENNIVHSKFDGIYPSGGVYGETPLINVIPCCQYHADVCVHRIGSTKDILPSDFRGISGGSVWKLAVSGSNGLPEKIEECFFSGVIISEGILNEDAIEKVVDIRSRGPDSLYNLFLRNLHQFSHQCAI